MDLRVLFDLAFPISFLRQVYLDIVAPFTFALDFHNGCGFKD